jgi:chaperonin GroES
MQNTIYTLDDKVIRAPLQPVSNFILVKMREASTQTSGGIVLPDQSQEKPTEGEVITAGPGRTHPHTAQLIPMCVAAGDRVMFSKWSGRKVQYQGIEHSIITDDDLLLVYNGETPTPDNLKMIRDQVRCGIHAKLALLVVLLASSGTSLLHNLLQCFYVDHLLHRRKALCLTNIL